MTATTFDTHGAHDREPTPRRSPAKLATVLRASRPTDTLAPDSATPHRLNLSGNWAKGAVVEVATRGRPGGPCMTTLLAGNATMALPSGTDRVTMVIKGTRDGVSLDASVEPHSEPQWVKPGKLPHEHLARKHGYSTGAYRAAR